MRTILLSLLASFLVFCSCNQKTPSRTPPNDADTTVVPQALQDDKSSGGYLSKGKRAPGDLVDELYEELKEKTPELQALEENIDRVKDERRDSSEAFSEYDQKNSQYYNAANRHIESIQDSATRERIKTLITKSVLGYESRTAASKDLLALLSKKDMTVNDLYTVLKLTKTLDIIEKYQRNSLPSTKPLEKVSKEYDKVINQL